MLTTNHGVYLHVCLCLAYSQAIETVTAGCRDLVCKIYVLDSVTASVCMSWRTVDILRDTQI